MAKKDEAKPAPKAAKAKAAPAEEAPAEEAPAEEAPAEEAPAEEATEELGVACDPQFQMGQSHIRTF